ncbi:MAG: hypothetical protein ISQ34_00340 [Rickettsiales bacterium]|nr:hypothetical protein [Rickettsiales bacterium]
MSDKKLRGTRISIDDFISPDTNVPESRVFKEDKLMAFSNIKVGVIDPRISHEVLELTKKIKEKIQAIDSLN